MEQGPSAEPKFYGLSCSIPRNYICQKWSDACDFRKILKNNRSNDIEETYQTDIINSTIYYQSTPIFENTFQEDTTSSWMFPQSTVNHKTTTQEEITDPTVFSKSTPSFDTVVREETTGSTIFSFSTPPIEKFTQEDKTVPTEFLPSKPTFVTASLTSLTKSTISPESTLKLETTRVPYPTDSTVYYRTTTQDFIKMIGSTFESNLRNDTSTISQTENSHVTLPTTNLYNKEYDLLSENNSNKKLNTTFDETSQLIRTDSIVSDKNKQNQTSQTKVELQKIIDSSLDEKIKVGTTRIPQTVTLSSQNFYTKTFTLLTTKSKPNRKIDETVHKSKNSKLKKVRDGKRKSKKKFKTNKSINKYSKNDENSKPIAINDVLNRLKEDIRKHNLNFSLSLQDKPNLGSNKKIMKPWSAILNRVLQTYNHTE
ncbi:uncharacterized protein LOC106655052 [Trichogramma pretiosum]|uniref:uncharacterized protein LOC106655052 n=1 Tax=Trichogramma pretiosum TaxID=7493 RepID=UPI0006C9543D|nr:uncharacterized protein LOC106655052 [Trichogramma pretiosum]